MNILVVYHGENCMDGFTSAWLATVAAGRAGYKKPELYPLTYAEGQEQALQQHIVNNVIMQNHYDIIYMLDICVSEQCFNVLVKTTNANIVCLDHHKSAFNMYAPDEPRTPDERQTIKLHGDQVTIALNNGMSGAGMAYMYFFPKEKEMPLLVQHVQDRDLWKFELENTKAIHQYLKQAKQTIESWTDINARMCHMNGYQEIVDYGELLIKETDKFFSGELA